MYFYLLVRCLLSAPAGQLRRLLLYGYALRLALGFASRVRVLSVR